MPIFKLNTDDYGEKHIICKDFQNGIGLLDSTFCGSNNQSMKAVVSKINSILRIYLVS